MGRAIAGIAVTLFICHVGYEITADAGRRLADGVDPPPWPLQSQPPGQ